MPSTLFLRLIYLRGSTVRPLQTYCSAKRIFDTRGIEGRVQDPTLRAVLISD
nr:MAG TPA: hypothetical protein [Caudoviricetes sp.]